jgi:F420-non-reducing hydrogenase small subunit
MPQASRPKVAMYWASSCGGCEIALVNLHEKLLTFDAHFDLYFCPCLVDQKVADVEALADGELAITFLNGAIRNSDNEEMAHLLRRKSKLVVAFGSCAVEGCIPGLANLTTRDDLLRTVYLDNPTTENAQGKLPQPQTQVAGGVVSLPVLLDTVRTLSQVIDVDYRIPGCPPEPHQIWNVVSLVISGAPLPPKGAFLGCGTSTVCNECTRTRRDKKVARFYRHHELIPREDECLLDQGLVCMGIATRDGCGALCPKVNMPCTGCYGPAPDVLDQGAKMVAALGSMLDVGGYEGLSAKEVKRRSDEALAGVPDLVGTFYKYSLPGSLLRGKSK